MLLILAAIFNEDLTALDIIAKIEKTAERKISLGGIYATLERLERAGLIEGEYREAEAEPGKKRPRRFYKILASGSRALNEIDLVKALGREARQ